VLPRLETGAIRSDASASPTGLTPLRSCVSTRRVSGVSRGWPVRFEPITETSAQLTIALEFEGHGIGRLLVPLIVERQAQREMPINLAALKEHLERSPR
jgi:hypothetical protein